jgi:peptidoglycan-associated lipoprotein
MSRSMSRPAILALCLAAALGGCMTKRVQPAPSPAIVEARAAAAAQKVHPTTRCATEPATMDPVAAPFAYGKAEITEEAAEALDAAAAWLSCRPEVVVVATGEADASGSKAVQATLPARRAQAVRDYLAAHGVSAERLPAARPASGEVLEIRAKGRGW